MREVLILRGGCSVAAATILSVEYRRLVPLLGYWGDDNLEIQLTALGADDVVLVLERMIGLALSTRPKRGVRSCPMTKKNYS